jgi:glycosyltransferase involved in cell wall biosynthesis
MTSPRRPESSKTADTPIRVLMITAGWPQPGQPQTTHFVKRQAEFLQRAGVQVDVFQFRGAKRLWNYARAWTQVRPMIRSGRYDLVHAQFGQSGALALPRRLPLVVTFRGSDILGIVGEDGRYTIAGKISQLVARLVARRADAVVVVSEHMKAYFRTAAPVLVLPSGLDFELFRCVPRDEARRRLGWPLDKRLVLFAGNPDQPRKRYPLAKAAVDLLNQKLPAELVVAWGVSHSDVPLYMNACDAFVFTSMQEGSPNVVKEALACDLPVVSVAIGDVEERLKGIEGCELCPDERPETIAACLERVLRRGQRVAGRIAVAPLAEEAITARLIGLYRTVLRRRPSDSPAGVEVVTADTTAPER